VRSKTAVTRPKVGAGGETAVSDYAFDLRNASDYAFDLRNAPNDGEFTRYAPPRVRLVDWLAVCAVRIEPCSASNSLINREFAGIWRKTARGHRFPRYMPRKSQRFSRIPYSSQQGIFRCLQGILGDERRMLSSFAWRSNDPEIQHSLAEMRPRARSPRRDSRDWAWPRSCRPPKCATALPGSAWVPGHNARKFLTRSLASGANLPARRSTCLRFVEMPAQPQKALPRVCTMPRTIQ
jgi:hypothetical protein